MIEPRARSERSRPSRVAGPIVVAWLVALVAVACSGKQTVVVWEKPGAGPEELEAARGVCLAETEALQTERVGINRDRLDAESTGACFVACMRRHGFTWRTEKVSASGEPLSDAGEDASGQPPAQDSGGASPDASGCSSIGLGDDGS